MDTIKIHKHTTQMVAHAGLLGMETPNTLAGVIAAGNRTHWGIEVDVRFTKDGEIVLIHNNTTGGVSPLDIPVEESTLAEVQRVPLYDYREFYGMEKYGLKMEKTLTRTDLRIPTLEEYLRLCKKYGKVAVIELKSDMTPDHIAYMLKQIHDLDYAEEVVFISFLWDALCEVRKQAPNMPIQFLTNEKREFTDGFLDEVAAAGFDLDINIATTTRELVERIHSRGMKVNVWTCDYPDKAAELVAWGVDYITSNILE